MKEETVDIDIFVKSRNGDRKVMQSIRIMSRPATRKIDNSIPYMDV